MNVLALIALLVCSGPMGTTIAENRERVCIKYERVCPIAADGVDLSGCYYFCAEYGSPGPSPLPSPSGSKAILGSMAMMMGATGSRRGGTYGANDDFGRYGYYNPHFRAPRRKAMIGGMGRMMNGYSYDNGYFGSSTPAGNWMMGSMRARDGYDDDYYYDNFVDESGDEEFSDDYYYGDDFPSDERLCIRSRVVCSRVRVNMGTMSMRGSCRRVCLVGRGTPPPAPTPAYYGGYLPYPHYTRHSHSPAYNYYGPHNHATTHNHRAPLPIRVPVTRPVPAHKPAPRPAPKPRPVPSPKPATTPTPKPRPAGKAMKMRGGRGGGTGMGSEGGTGKGMRGKAMVSSMGAEGMGEGGKGTKGKFMMGSMGGESSEGKGKGGERMSGKGMMGGYN